VERTTPYPSPGRFRHPKISEIITRQAATKLTPQRSWNALLNLTALLATFSFNYIIRTRYVIESPILGLPQLLTITRSDVLLLSIFDTSIASWYHPYMGTALLVLRLHFCIRIILALRPVIPYISEQDDFSDIPLTPTQRALLGLNPSTQSTPVSAASDVHYITPPKYRHSPGSTTNGGVITDRRSVSANYSDSPFSASRNTFGFSQTPHSNRRASGSPFSQSPTASPLFHKAVNQSSRKVSDVDFSASTQSFGLGTGTGLGRSQSLRERSRRDSLEPGSPTPGTRSPQLVPGVNYKWLYEKGRKLPKSESFGSFGL